MPDITLLKWQDIKADFDDCLLLGNGASIAIDSRFAYSSLLEEARNNRRITPTADRVFRQFQTNDFEYILNVLSITNSTNRALNVADRVTQRMYNIVRKTLIDIVRDVHPEERDISHYFPQIAPFLRHFSMIVSLNYDLILILGYFMGE